MDLIIKNASLEEVTAICYRIGEPNFQEQVESERKFGVVEYLVNHGVAIQDAEKAYDNDLENAEAQTAIASGEFKKTEEAAKEEPEPVKQEELHLEAPPEKPKEPVVNLKESLHQIASELVDKKGSTTLVSILSEFGAKSVPELNENHYEAAIQKIKEAL